MNTAARVFLTLLFAATGMIFGAGVRPAIIVRDTPALHGSTSLTVDGWFYLKQEQPGDSVRLISKYSHLSPEERGWELVMENNRLAFRTHCMFPLGERQDFQVVSKVEVPRERWVHLAGVFADEGNGLRNTYVFIDGVQSGKLSLPQNVELNPNFTVDVLVGVYSGLLSSQADMLVDDIRISGRAIYFNGVPKEPASADIPGTLALFSFDEPEYAAPGIVAGVVGEANLVQGRFGLAADMTGNVDPTLFQKARTLGRPPRLEDNLYGDFGLMVYTSQAQAELQLFCQNDTVYPLKLELLDETTGRKVYEATGDIHKKGTFSIPLGDLKDGTYMAVVKDSSGDVQGELHRRLRLQRPLLMAIPPEPIDFTAGGLVFPVDEYDFVQRNNVADFVNQPEVVLVTKSMGPEASWQWTCSPDWLQVTKDGTLVYNFSAGRDWERKDAKAFHSTSKDGVHWETAPGNMLVDQDLSQRAYETPESAVPHWGDKAPFNDSEIHVWRSEDGMPPLSEIRVACIAPHIGDAAAHGLLSWGTYPVWERKKGEWIILSDKAMCVAKFGYSESELETFPDANDNFGGQCLSDDGSQLYYYQAAKLRCFAPRAVEYDNIADSFRQMRVFTSRDGFNWSARYLAPPDEKDAPTLQHYGMTTVRVAPDFRIGLLHAYNVEKQQIYSELFYSRDNVEWRRLNDRTPFFHNTDKPGSPFFGMLFPDFDATPIREYNGEYYIALGSLWHQRPHFYFSYAVPQDKGGYTPKALERTYGGKKLAERWPFFQAIGGWQGLSEDYARFDAGKGVRLGYGKIPRNRWIAVRANGEGMLRGRLWKAPGRRLLLNGKGHFSVELLNEAETPIPGYSGADAAHFNGDDIEAPLVFGKGKELPDCPFRVIVRLANGSELYAIEVR